MIILTNEENQKIKVEVENIINYKQKDINYFNTITKVKLKNGYILYVLENENLIKKMIDEYYGIQ